MSTTAPDILFIHAKPTHLRSLSLHDALPISWSQQAADLANAKVASMGINRIGLVKTNGYVSPPLDGVWLRARSEEHTSELQSQSNLVCRLMREKKRKL